MNSILPLLCAELCSSWTACIVCMKEPMLWTKAAAEVVDEIRNAGFHGNKAGRAPPLPRPASTLFNSTTSAFMTFACVTAPSNAD